MFANEYEDWFIKERENVTCKRERMYVKERENVCKRERECMYKREKMYVKGRENVCTRQYIDHSCLQMRTIKNEMTDFIKGNI